ncbi:MULTISPECIES: nucleoside hydrolase [Brevibacterium]|uniref:Inosine-uridine nucleoside N-ribohydrolase n=2 Tax=Brevibacterium TaxID=1696 RepID=A0A1H1LCT6_BRESA|nr:nucleoside hydrolase [Brevibacterium sandarakinum]SDR72323.1 Inosine-uridine nucleoside N-ribohydrolase [Brevibacterium sandarakinum]
MPSELPLFLDCDPGIDDALALGYLLCQDDVDISGIAASGGNVATAQVVANAQGWLELAGRTDIPIHAGQSLPLAWTASERGPQTAVPAGAEHELVEPDGAEPEYADLTHGPNGAGYAHLPAPSVPTSSVSAAQAWVDAARTHPGELIGVVIGPATNLALALDLDPELPRLMRRLFIMGGAFNYRGNTHPTTEWNVTFDPESTARVLSAFDPSHSGGAPDHLPVIAPIEATEALEMTPGRLKAILGCASAPDNGTHRSDAPLPVVGRSAAGRNRWDDWLTQMAEALRFYFEFHEWDGLGYIAHIHDPFVLACALEWAREHRRRATSAAVDDSAPTNNPIPNGTRGTLPWAETICAPVDIELTGTLTRGETVADWLGRWGKEANAEIIRTIDAQLFLDHLGETLSKGPHHEHDI